MYSLDCLNIYLGWMCNLHCRHCWVCADDVEKKEKNRIDMVHILRGIEEAVSLGLKILKISGGEPFLYLEDMCEIISYANHYKLEVNIETNGTILKEEVLKLLNPEKSYINISLDGHDEYSHNKMRGNNKAFQNTLNGIDLIQRRGLSFGITHSIHDGNIRNIDLMIDFLDKMSVRELKLNPIMAIGRAQNEKLKAPVLLNLENLIYVYDKYNNYNKGKVHVNIMVPPCFVKPYEMLIGKKEICRCNYLNMLSILPDGSIGLCGEAKDIKAFQFGNLEYESLGAIWNDSKNLKEMRKKADNLVGVCSKCKYNTMCKGGCRIIAYVYGNEVEASNPIADIYYKKYGYLPWNS